VGHAKMMSSSHWAGPVSWQLVVRNWLLSLPSVSLLLLLVPLWDLCEGKELGVVTLVSFSEVVVVGVNRLGVVCSCSSSNVCNGDNNNSSRDGSDVNNPNYKCCSSRFSSCSGICNSSGSRVVVNSFRLYCHSSFSGCWNNRKTKKKCACVIIYCLKIVLFVYMKNITNLILFGLLSVLSFLLFFPSLFPIAEFFWTLASIPLFV
jgi:hypothetical protein